MLPLRLPLTRLRSSRFSVHLSRVRMCLPFAACFFFIATSSRVVAFVVPVAACVRLFVIHAQQSWLLPARTAEIVILPLVSDEAMDSPISLWRLTAEAMYFRSFFSV